MSQVKLFHRSFYVKRITGIRYIRKLGKTLFNACQMVRIWSRGESLMLGKELILKIMGTQKLQN